MTTTRATTLPTWIALAWPTLLSTITLWPFWRALWPFEAAAADSAAAFMLRDMFAGPTLALNLPALGAGNTPPRAVPQDTLLALFSPLIPADTLLALIVLTSAILGGWGAARLAAHTFTITTNTPSRTRASAIAAQLLAPLLTLWNPYTLERILQGQWSVTAAAMMLPAVAYLSLHITSLTHTTKPTTTTKTAEPIQSPKTEPQQTTPLSRWGALTFAMALCAITPTGILLATITALAFATHWPQRASIALIATLLSTPWILAAIFSTAPSTADPRSAVAFAAAPAPGVGNNPLGTLWTLLGLGGIWNADATAPSRGGWSVTAGAILLLVLVTAGTYITARHAHTVTRSALAIVASATLLPAALATPPGLAFMSILLEYIPGAGLLRDTSKFVALAIPGLVALLGTAFSALSAISSTTTITITTTAAAAAAIVATVPGYPADIADAAQQPLPRDLTTISNIIAAEPESGIALLPPGNYRTRPDGIGSIDPALKILPGDPIDPGYLIVDGQLIDGDPTAMTMLRELLHGEDHLAEHGIGWVLVATPDAAEVGDAHTVLSHQNKVFDSENYTLYRTAETVHYQAKSTTPTLIGLTMYGIVVTAAAASVGVGASRRPPAEATPTPGPSQPN